jgi:hypothetical protein
LLKVQFRVHSKFLSVPLSLFLWLTMEY